MLSGIARYIRSSIKVVAAFSILIVLVCFQALGNEETSADFPEASAPDLHSFGWVRLSREDQELSGILTQVIEPGEYQAESRAFGSVLSIETLLEYAQRFQTAASEYAIALAQRATAQSAHAQDQALFDDRIIARSQFEQSKLEWIRAKARVDQTAALQRSIRASAEQHWGKVLTAWAFNPNDPNFDELVEHRAVLLNLILPAGFRLAAGTRRVWVNHSASRAQAQPAEWISPAPMAAANSQGESHFFRCPAEFLRSGMQLYVWIPEPGEARKVLAVPESAVLWRDGKAWVYRKMTADSFQRLTLASSFDQDDRFFLENSEGQTVEIVVSGAQTLLSQELHWQIPDEDDE